MANGQVVDMSWEDYREYDAVNQSTLKQFARDPEAFRAQELGLEARKTTSAMVYGSQLEEYLFTGEMPFRLIPDGVLNEKGERRGKAWTEWKTQVEAELPGVELLKADEYAERSEGMLRAAQNIRDHSRANALLLDNRNVLRHQRVIWTDDETGAVCKAEIDAVHLAGRIIDLKTSSEIQPSEFNRSIFKFGYHIQAAWYRRAVKEITGDWLPFSIVASKNKPGWGCEVFDLSAEWVELGEEWLRVWFPAYLEARQKDHYRTPSWGKSVELLPERWMLTRNV